MPAVTSCAIAGASARTSPSTVTPVRDAPGRTPIFNPQVLRRILRNWRNDITGAVKRLEKSGVRRQEPESTPGLRTAFELALLLPSAGGDCGLRRLAGRLLPRVGALQGVLL